MIHGNVCAENLMVIELNKIYDLAEYKEQEFYRQFKSKESKRNKFNNQDYGGEHK